MYKTITLTLGLAIFFCSCGNAPAASGETTEEAVTPPAIEMEETIAGVNSDKQRFVSIITGLRIREAPQTDSEIVGEMTYGQLAEYLGEESSVPEKITLRGRDYYEKWKKVKVLTNNFEEEIVGWVYGGGLVDEQSVFVKDNSGKYQQQIIRAKRAEINHLVDFDLADGYYYDGYITYQQFADGNRKKDGALTLKGEQIELPQEAIAVGINITMTYAGAYEDGLLHGLLTRNFEGYESASEAKINFAKGRCLWSSFEAAAEGDVFSSHEEEPAECSFDYIEHKAI